MSVLAVLIAFILVFGSARRGGDEVGRERRVPRGENFLVDQPATGPDSPVR